MYRFKLSAPGTTFLCGEPNRRNNTCIAASLDMRTTLTFSSFPPAVVRIEFIEIDFSSIQLHVKIPLRQFYIHFYGENYNNIFSCVTVHEVVKNFITSMTDYDGIYEPSNQTHQLSLQAFFFLLILISRKEHIIISSSFIVKLSTELPIGEGLGSSASFAVCLAACFWRWSLLQKGTVLYEFGKQDLLKISNYAQNCDSIIYNSSTKIDTIISTYGMIKIFDKGIINTLTSKSFSNLPDMKILLVFSNVKKTKSKKSMKIEALKNSHLLIDFILNSIEVISSTFIYVLDIIDVKIYNRLKKNNSQFINITDNYKTLLDIIHMNQGLLKTLGMSHPNLDIICAIARNFGFAGKLASKSGGGYAFILLPNSTDENIHDLIVILESYDFFAKIATLNCSGIRIE